MTASSYITDNYKGKKDYSTMSAIEVFDTFEVISYFISKFTWKGEELFGFFWWMYWLLS